MKYDWAFDESVIKSFKKLDRPVQVQIIKWLNKNIKGSENPRWTGKGLTGDLAGVWRYRVGKYRILTEIQDNVAIVMVIRAEKRETVYDE